MNSSKEPKIQERIKEITLNQNGIYDDSALIFTTQTGYGYSLYGLDRQGTYCEDVFGFDTPEAAETAAKEHFDLLKNERPPQNKTEAREHAISEGKLLKFPNK
ncbi:MAG: hypothetical protein HY231_13905 [Acidobacteria bacterium]|nr:hypothetical protein [Acidobacteriota bacterium]